MTVLQIIAKLWSHITDLRLYARGKSSKTLAEIEKDIAITECYCSVYMEQGDAAMRIRAEPEQH